MLCAFEVSCTGHSNENPTQSLVSGHVNFSDEVTAAFRLCDGVMIFVDASEGVSCLIRTFFYYSQEKLAFSSLDFSFLISSFFFLSLSFYSHQISSLFSPPLSLSFLQFSSLLSSPLFPSHFFTSSVQFSFLFSPPLPSYSAHSALIIPFSHRFLSDLFSCRTTVMPDLWFGYCVIFSVDLKMVRSGMGSTYHPILNTLCFSCIYCDFSFPFR